MFHPQKQQERWERVHKKYTKYINGLNFSDIYTQCQISVHLQLKSEHAKARAWFQSLIYVMIIFKIIITVIINML